MRRSTPPAGIFVSLEVGTGTIAEIRSGSAATRCACACGANRGWSSAGMTACAAVGRVGLGVNAVAAAFCQTIASVVHLARSCLARQRCTDARLTRGAAGLVHMAAVGGALLVLRIGLAIAIVVNAVGAGLSHTGIDVGVVVVAVGSPAIRAQITVIVSVCTGSQGLTSTMDQGECGYHHPNQAQPQ
jgi:hypothetical protein